MALFSKRAEALEVAQIIVESGDTDVESVESDVENWSDHDLYGWIELWGYTWVEGSGWVCPIEEGGEE